MKGILGSFVAVALLVVGVAGLGGAAGKMSPEEIGKAIGNVYVKSLTDAVNLTNAKPEAAKVKPQLEKLKEGAIKQLVELGKQREALPAAGKSKVDSNTRMTINRVPRDVFTKYGEACNYYIGKDANNETNALLTSFNVITQYASFELLKKQEPDEAKRLGIK